LFLQLRTYGLKDLEEIRLEAKGYFTSMAMIGIGARNSCYCVSLHNRLLSHALLEILPTSA